MCVCVYKAPIWRVFVHIEGASQSLEGLAHTEGAFWCPWDLRIGINTHFWVFPYRWYRKVFLEALYRVEERLHKDPVGFGRASWTSKWLYRIFPRFQGNISCFPVSSCTMVILAFHTDSCDWHFYANSLIFLAKQPCLQVSLKFVTYLISKNTAVF